MKPEAPNGEPKAPEDQNGGPQPETGAAARVADLEAELADCKDRLLRALAEQENARRRALREREEAVRFAASGLARDLLATADNLRRAIESVPEERTADETVRRLLTGVVATERALLEALAKHSIRRIASLGEPFDPERHEAVFEGRTRSGRRAPWPRCSRRVTCTMTGCCARRWSASRKSGESEEYTEENSDDRREEPPPLHRSD